MSMRLVCISLTSRSISSILPVKIEIKYSVQQQYIHMLARGNFHPFLHEKVWGFPSWCTVTPRPSVSSAYMVVSTRMLSAVITIKKNKIFLKLIYWELLIKRTYVWSSHSRNILLQVEYALNWITSNSVSLLPKFTEPPDMGTCRWCVRYYWYQFWVYTFWTLGYPWAAVCRYYW